MVLYYLERRGDRNPGIEGRSVDKIIATGNVRIERTGGGLATAEEAVYYQEDEKVVLTGRPVVKQKQDFVEGTKITLFLKEKRSVVEGTKGKKVRAVFHQKEKNDEPVGR